MKPMKFRSVGADAVDELLADPEWVAEQKMDGTRGLVKLTAHGVDLNGLSHTAAVQWKSQIAEGLANVVGQLVDDDEIWLDGEIMIHNGEYRVFDMPYCRMHGNRLVKLDDALRSRRIALVALSHGFRSPVSVVFQARGLFEKSGLVSQAEEAGAEGVVFKRLDGAYQPGWRVTHQLKYQFIKRADFVVMKRGERSASLGIYYDGMLRHVASCSLIGKGAVEAGDVVEVKYLYQNPGGGFVQPRMVRVRPDKSPEECTAEQFARYAPYSREAV